MKLSFRRSAFTLIEIMIATAILGILASAVAVNYSRTLSQSRDGRRKSDVQTYAQAMGSYLAANGNTFVYIKGASCTFSSTSQTDPTVPATGAGCVGANGHGYGLINASGGVSSATTPNDAGLPYNSSTSIAKALNGWGYLSTISSDPNSKSASGGNPGYPDYILMRCCKDGRENISNGGSTYAIWTHLENAPASSDTNNANLDCGGTQTATMAQSAAYPGQTPPPPYEYDFAAGAYNTDSSATGDNQLNYAAGPAIGSTSYLGSCES